MLALVAAAVLADGATVAASEEATLFRVFLSNGTALVSYGEYARVGDRVMFSMPIGAVSSDPRLHLVNLPASVVDWPATERYAESARHAHYAATRGDSDFALLSADVARVLNTVALTPDKTRRLDMALGARRMLAEWPQMHYGYRSIDVAQILAVLDEAISELRAAAGATTFDLNFVTTTLPPPMALLPDPSPSEALDQALAVARVTDVPAERISLLRSVAAALDMPNAPISSGWANGMRELVKSDINVEMSIERRYAGLSRSMLKAASSSAMHADVRGVETVLAKIRRRDDRLGRKRPEQIAALLQAVESKLDGARRLRLARDQWTLRSSTYRSYRRSVKHVLERFDESQSKLEDIRKLAGPAASALLELADMMPRIGAELAKVIPPEELRPVHTLMMSAAQLAGSAARIRRDAILSGNVRTAWDASAAAAGSMMLMARARADLETLMKPPQLQ